MPKVILTENDAEQIRHNRSQYIERLDLYKTYGYDTELERDFIIRCSKPLGNEILELGTGRGHFTVALARQEFQFTTCDRDEEQMKTAYLNLAYYELQNQVTFFVENGEAMGFKDKYFDAVFCVNTLHHITDAGLVLNELIRVAKDSGKIILSDFTEKTFEIMDQIHSLEEKKHEVTGSSFNNACHFLAEAGFLCRLVNDDFQNVAVCERV